MYKVGLGLLLHDRDMSRKFTNFELSPGVAAFVRAGADEFSACHMLIYSSDASQYLFNEWMTLENIAKCTTDPGVDCFDQ